MLSNIDNLSGKTKGLALIFFILFMGFISFLLVSNYLSLKKLRDSSLKQYEYELRQRTTELTTFLYDHSHNMYNLSRKDKLRLYFENKALGMSMEYGLRASILGIKQLLKAQLSAEHANNRTMILRITYLDNTGNIIADTAQTDEENKFETFSFLDVISNLSEGFYIYENQGGKKQTLIYIQPFYFKNSREGQLVSSIDIKAITKQYLHPGDTSLFTGILYKPDLLVKNDPENEEKDQTTYDLVLQEENIASLYSRFAKNERVLTFREPIFPYGLEIIELTSAKEVLGTTAPGTFLLAIILLGISFIIAAVILMRIFARNIALQTHIIESHEREKAIAVKNQELESEIYERKKSEHARIELEIQLQRAQKMESIGQLAGGVAHDFNNMLGVILGNVELAMMEIDSSHPIFIDLKEIRTAAEHSADITRKLLAFARRQTVIPKILHLSKTIEEMLTVLHRLIGENIELSIQPGANLWPVKVDPTQIDQILVNLCINAQAAINGIGEILVKTENITITDNGVGIHTGLEPGEYVQISVSDNGTGMDSSTLAHIFEPFFTTKEVGEGSGLGLATVYGAVKQNNGFIQVESEPAKGTTFTISFPRHLADAKDIKTENSKATALGGRETILLVEDEPMILNMTSKMLDQLGYTVITASNPNDCIAMVKNLNQNLDILITDVVMPKMNGHELAKQLLTTNPQLKCLFMSGYTDNIHAVKDILMEKMFFIQKPFMLKELDTKIREALNS